MQVNRRPLNQLSLAFKDIEVEASDREGVAEVEEVEGAGGDSFTLEIIFEQVQFFNWI